MIKITDASVKKLPFVCWTKGSFIGAGSRGRTDTVSLPLDFESSTSANSIIPAYDKWYYTIFKSKNQGLF